MRKITPKGPITNDIFKSKKYSKWTGSGKRYTLKEMQEIPMVDVVRMGTGERAELLEQMRRIVENRRKSFKRAGTTGYAFDKLMDELDEVTDATGDIINIQVPVIKTTGRTRELSEQWKATGSTQNRLLQYISLFQDFLQAKTSTVAGWKKFTNQQDRFLFGSYHNSPKYKMTDDERKMFFKVWREIKSKGWTPVADYYSLVNEGYARLWMEDQSFDHTNLEAAYAKMSERFGSIIERFKEGKPGGGNPFQQAAESGGDGTFEEFDWKA